MLALAVTAARARATSASVGEVADAARSLVERGVETVYTSMGADGVLVVSAVGVVHAHAVATAVVLYALSWRRGIDGQRLVLVGIGLGAALARERPVALRHGPAGRRPGRPRAGPLACAHHATAGAGACALGEMNCSTLLLLLYYNVCAYTTDCCYCYTTTYALTLPTTASYTTTYALALPTTATATATAAPQRYACTTNYC